MAENKKIEKALYGPSTTEVALGAVLGLVVGVVAACVYLVFKPVSTVREMPKEPVRGMLYYLAGSDSSTKGRTWSAKQKQFLAGTSVSLVEDELNAWAVATFGAAPRAKPKGPAGAPTAPKAEGDKSDDSIFQPSTPNFRIVDDKLQIGFKCVLNWYGLTQEVQVLSTGTLVHSGDRFVYEPATVYLGSCPLHLLPAVSSMLFDHLMGKKQLPDDLKSAWVKLTDVKIEGSTLTLTVQ
jgi:hypothetical protein